jgi:hypothetical protein
VELIYETISSNPGYFAWAFGLVNVAWGLFLYFDRKQHEKDLERLRHQHALDLQKRSEMYEFKATQFQNYFRLMDEFSRKHRSDYSEKVQPLLDCFTQDYLEAESREDKSVSTQAITQFGSGIGRLMADSHEEHLAIKTETNNLRLIASNEVIALLDQVQAANDSALAAANELMNNYVQMVVAGDLTEMARRQHILYQAGETIMGLKTSLVEQMRRELSEI